MDELEDYLSGGIYTSSVGQYLVAIGEKPGKNEMKFAEIGVTDISLHGMLFGWPDFWSNYKNQWDEFENTTPGRLNLMYSLADANDVPLLWVGEANANWRENTGTVETGRIQKNSGEYQVETESVPTKSFESYLQRIFNTDLKATGTGKDAEKTIPLQEWGRKNLPGDYVTLDLDVVVADTTGSPKGIGEIKRTYQPIQSWSPYEFPDKLNYYLQHIVCNGVDATPFIVKHQKESVTDSNHVKYYQYHCDPKTNDWIDIDIEEKITGSELQNRIRQFR